VPIHAGVPRGSLLNHLLYTLYKHDLPTSHKTLIGTFADDTAICASHENPTTASTNLQDHLILIEEWLRKWKIKVNETSPSKQRSLSEKAGAPPVQLNHTNIQQKVQARYLGITFDSKLNWRHHIVKKRK
jgi:hypothetical protein